MEYTVRTTRYGREETVSVPEDAVYDLGPGILGFDELRRYALLPEEGSPLEWVQAMDDADIAFAVLDPFLFYPDYSFELGDADVEALGLARPEDARVRVILTLHESAEGITANLMAPLVLNPRMRRARQVVLQESELPLRFPVLEALQMPMSA
jgi:flagellar assembly factor FliW